VLFNNPGVSDRSDFPAERFDVDAFQRVIEAELHGSNIHAGDGFVPMTGSAAISTA